MYVSREVAIIGEPETNGWCLVVCQVGHILRAAGWSTCGSNMNVHIVTHVWQSSAEIEMNSVVYFHHCVQSTLSLNFH